MEYTHKTLWLQDAELGQLQVLMVRYALRAFPAICPKSGGRPFDEQYFLRHARSLIAACCFLADRSEETHAAAAFAAFAAGDFTRNKLQTAASIAAEAASKSLVLGDEGEARDTILNAIELLPLTDFFEQAKWDLEQFQRKPMRSPISPSPLWTVPLLHFSADQQIPLPNDHELKSRLSFWLEWYQGFLDGKLVDWELQRRVALIDDAIWDAGPEAVAAEIKRIRAEFRVQPAGKERFPKHEPKSVSHLFENRVVASASLQGLAAQVTQSIERFHAETGANALPEALEALAALPALLLAVNATIQAAPLDGAVASETEDQLRAEIGRLNAKVAQLENELQKACSAKPSGFSDAFKKQLGTSLGDWKLYAALCTGLWFVSGDAEGTQRRLENISLYHDMIFGEVSSPSKSAPKHPTAAIESTLEI